jgi:hypothetical protein
MFFMFHGKRIVYVIKGNDFEAREIKITTETESRAVVDGLSAGTKIALVNPNLSKPSASSSSAQAGMGAGIH